MQFAWLLIAPPSLFINLMDAAASDFFNRSYSKQQEAFEPLTTAIAFLKIFVFDLT